MITEVQIIDLMIELSTKAKKDGLLSLESKVAEIGDPFIKKGIQMVIDGTEEDLIQEILETEISAMEKRHETNASIFSSAGMYAPTLGVLGAVFGLIAAMSHIDDTETNGRSNCCRICSNDSWYLYRICTMESLCKKN